MSAISYGGFPTGWTGYPPLALQANAGMDAYIFAFFLVAVAMILNAVNLMVTIITMRAPGLTWNRLPIFVWSMLATTVLMLLGAPVLVAGLLMEALDRTSGTNFFVAGAGGSPFLFENLFWFFGHPEVYILALPGFGIVLEILPVFARKPLWGYRLAVSGLLGVALLSFMVWQHHLFVSGINSNLRPFYMLTTELISVPTGFVFLAGMGTLWRARIRYTVPMLFSLAFFFNFLIGGLSGVFLSDVPSDVSLHGSYFVMAHFHYTIMGGLIFAFFAGFYYWLPKMNGLQLNERLAQDPLLDDVRVLQLDLPAAVRAGPDGHAAARLDLRAAPAVPERLGVGVGVRPRHLDARVPGQPGLLLRHRADPGRRQPVAVARPRVAGADAGAARELRRGADHPGRPVRVRRRHRPAGGAARPDPARGGRRLTWRSPATSPPNRLPTARCSSARGCSWPGMPSSSWASCSRTSTCVR